MKYSGLYFVSNPSTTVDASLAVLNSLTQSIERTFTSTTQQTPWSLQYRVFRDTIPPDTPTSDAEGKPKPFSHTLQHLLHISSIHQDRAYICIQPPTGTSTVSAIPKNQQDAHALLLRNQFAALWQPRHVLNIAQGTSYSVGQFAIQMGELRVTREGQQSAGVQSPGVVICISTLAGTDDPDDSMDEGDEDFNFDYAQEMIRECWNMIKDGQDLGKSEVREVMMAPIYVKGTKENDATVQMWCETLRLRG